ncbi:MAG: hypothetical protein CR974_02170 [Gammaproteobacteria bacterium]|nr:MAG: hypothetical protein CR974_02170 [Gammaproteobacteria bacterium]
MLIVSLIATLSYACATWLLQCDSGRRMVVVASMLLAALAHALAVVAVFQGWMHNVSVTNMLSLVSLGMALLGTVRYLFCRDRIAYPVVALMAAVCVWAPIGVSLPATLAEGWALKTHIVLSIAAYMSLAFAALYALFLLLQDYRLRRGRDGFHLSVSLNDLSLSMIGFTRLGEGLLTLSLVTGAFFIHDIWAQRVGHKLFFGVIAWTIIGIVLLLHKLQGFRGRLAALWVLGGFLCLVLAYFGSAFVLQILLHE